jgi:hypothetical protein
VPLIEQQAHGVCADVSGAARNQNFKTHKF